MELSILRPFRMAPNRLHNIKGREGEWLQLYPPQAHCELSPGVIPTLYLLKVFLISVTLSRLSCACWLFSWKDFFVVFFLNF